MNKDPEGYNRVKFDRKTQRLHRLIWYFCYGTVPEGKVVCHSCNNKGCINPFHLYTATAELNSTHAARDKLYKSGSEQPSAVFKDEDIETLFRLYYKDYVSQQKIADRYGVSQSNVSKILRGAAYKHIAKPLYDKYKDNR